MPGWLTQSQHKSKQCKWTSVKNIDEKELETQCHGVRVANADDKGEGGTSISMDLMHGSIDCFINVSVGFALNKLRNVDQIKDLATAISDAKNYDIILNKLSQIMSADDVTKYIQALSTNGIKKGVDVEWLE